MIPVKLEIQGLYSYKEKQTIEFEQLTGAGLFGIFGAVGSGKSSILEAILLALYGSTERLSDRGEKNSMLNLQSKTLLINFEFRSGKNNSKSYLARYAAKRNPKNFEEVRPGEHTFYEKDGDNLIPITQGGEEIVGMKKEHFKQTVIIPQGKFREFIDLTPQPRAEMMKELFGLERFDLSQKTGSLLKAVREEKIRLETQLLALVDYSPEALKDKENLRSEKTIFLEKEEKTFQTLEAESKKQEALQAKNLQLIERQKEWNNLEIQRPEIEAKKAIWKDFLKAKTYLKPVWDQIQEAKIELEKYRVSVKNCTDFKKTYEGEVADLVKQEAELKIKADDRPNREAKIRDLKKVIEIKGLLAGLKDAEKQVETLSPHIESLKNSQKDIENAIKEKESKIEGIKLPDTDEISNLKSAAKDWTNLESQLAKLTEDFNLLRQTSTSLDTAIFDIQKQIPSGFDSFGTWIENQKKQIQNLETDKEKLLSKKGLAAHVHLLQDGEACPLCGATEHPDPITASQEESEWNDLSKQIEGAKSSLEKIVNLSQQLSEQQIRQENHRQNLAAKEKELADSKKELTSLMESLKLKNIPSKESLSKLIGDTDLALKQKDQLAQEIRELRKSQEQGKALLEKEEQQLRAAEQKQVALHSTVAAKKDEIKDPIFTKPFFEKPTDYIENAIFTVEKDIEKTIQDLDGKRKVLQETRAKQSTNLANLKNFEDLVEKTIVKIVELESQYETLKKTHGFESESDLQALYHHSLDADKTDAEIRQYEDRRLLVQNNLDKLKEEDGVLDFSQEAFGRLLDELKEKRSSLEGFRKQLTLLIQDIEDSKTKLNKKQELAKEFSILENRESNLRELDNLFRGSGFVKYVSTIYLKELCNTANLRFMKLTKNSLSLEIDDNNTFWVVDYLNGGKKRLLKTLSGGQTFQASLCLALALAEKVKSLNQADQSFFFLDEGFGALDRNALRVVFETLKSLRHENRIVGIISHVEELQQEIGVYAKIELDPEKGSQVGYSF
ncbi:SbcC/MukB-like Walker B domain-containing protein [Aquiflexum gelatinilyticum]|uniref:SMC family ATPase n=1 Tax=Aquiflexum gelatinilyticum TaxID=2961943 RepID=A0A9X2PAM8_9BACT|nr:SMC family ATPase [Aquiflexum gelatinilyticum]MCR9016527.1 SMC family ATPase [Aquiflexum gelatinilyticum]